MSQPRKSVSSRRRSVVKKSESTTPTPAAKEPSQVASSSKMTLDMPPPDVPESITWDYTPPEHRPVQELSEDDKDRLIHEVSLPQSYSFCMRIDELMAAPQLCAVQCPARYRGACAITDLSDSHECGAVGADDGVGAARV